MGELQVYSKRLRNSGAVVAAALLLFALNAFIGWRLFGLEWSTHLGSIEGAYISMTKYFALHGYSLTWFPLWYSGEPLRNTYPPLLMWLSTSVKLLTGWTPQHSYHFITGLEYAAGPVTVFLLAHSLSKKLAPSLAGGLIYTGFNFSSFFIREVRSDVGGPLLSRRLQVLIPYGEGPHLLTLILLPVAILLLHRALTRRKPIDFSLAIFGFTIVLLSNVMGVLATLFGVFAYLITRDEMKLSDWLLSLGLGIAAYAVTSMWIPPSMSAIISERAKLVGGDYTHTYEMAPVVFPMIFATAAFIGYLMRRWNLDSTLAFFTVACFFFAVICLPAYWLKVDFTPMPKRYHVEVDMLFPFIVTFALAMLPWKRWPKQIPMAVAAVLLVGTVALLPGLLKQSKNVLGSLEIEKTSEYKFAKEFAKRSRTARVLAPGDTGSWLNAFEEIPQWDGGFVQAVPNPNYAAVNYLITSNAGGEQNVPAAVLWFKAFGIARVGTSGPGSTEYYKPFENPTKFQTLLRESWHEGGDTIYEVPLHSDGWIHVVPKDALVVHAPENGLDVKETARYVAALEKEPTEPRIQWVSPASARIQATIQPGDAISAQISYVAGWHARVAGKELPVSSDGLGQIKIVPEQAGPLDITLEYDGGIETFLTRILSVVSIVGTVLFGLFGDWNRKRQSA